MIPPFSYSLASAAAEFFSERTKREREELIRIFRMLADSPFQKGDWVQKTLLGRDLQVKRFGAWLVTFWPDAPILEVRILDIEKL